MTTLVLNECLVRTARRSNSDAFLFKTGAQFTRELDRARRVAMNTNRFAAHLHIRAFDGADLALSQHPQNALSGFFRIMK